MTKVQATIRIERLHEVVERLRMIGAKDLIVSTVQGFGRNDRHQAVLRGTVCSLDFRPKVVLEWVGEDDAVDAVVRAIVKAARTGRVGDGKIFLSPIENRIRHHG